MKKLVWLLLAALFIFVVGCSGSSGVTPDRDMEEFFANLTYDDSIAGNFTLYDQEGVVLAEGTLVKDQNGNLAMGDIRTGEIWIDLTWLHWVNCTVDYHNPVGYLPSGAVLYYIGMTMEYDLNVQNFGPQIMSANLRTQQRYYGGPYHLELLPGASTEMWYDVTLPNGISSWYDTYYIPVGTHPGNDITHASVWIPINIWFLQLDLVLFDCCAGIWDP